jgi:hypothetical protein
VVVEIRFNDVQRSRRYPGGVALRFARVVRYREDKSPAEADTLASLLARVPEAPAPAAGGEARDPGAQPRPTSKSRKKTKDERQLSLFEK